jgi:hypothetical protein
MKRWQAVIGVMLATFLLAGCAATVPVPVSRPEIPSTPPVEPAPEPSPPRPAPGLPPRPVPADRDLLLEGIATLGRAEKPDPPEARRIFSALVEKHPQSRWRPAAETLIHLIDEGQKARERELQERILKERALAERSRALQENEQLKKAVRDLTERLQAETAALAQENDQLKSDLKRLKALEIELQRRERMLR